MKNYTLIAVVGKTDPIRSKHDGPILHIIRHFRPRRVVLILSEEIGKDEEKYHYNENAIHLLDKECQVESVFTGIKNVHSYDEFPLPLLQTCNQIKEKYAEDKILLDVTSGTPQLETALCMIALSDTERYLAVQVESPEKSSNKSPIFIPGKDSLETWYHEDKDNDEGHENRCRTPQLLNFKRPLVQGQIISLIRNYDYMAANQMYQENKGMFSNETGLLLSHAVERLNLEYEAAKKIAGQMNDGVRERLGLISDQDVAELVEFFNSMHVKQKRGELNDFVLRIEILTEYLAVYLLKKGMGVSLEDISNKEKRKHSWLYRLDKEKCEGRMPGITSYLDGLYKKPYEWGKELNARSMVQIAEFMSNKKEYRKYQRCICEMKKWIKISGAVRNPAAHTIIAITEKHIQDVYDRKGTEMLCKNIIFVLKIVFDKKINPKAFETYDNLNQLICESLEK